MIPLGIITHKYVCTNLIDVFVSHTEMVLLHFFIIVMLSYLLNVYVNI